MSEPSESFFIYTSNHISVTYISKSLSNLSIAKNKYRRDHESHTGQVPIRTEN